MQCDYEHQFILQFNRSGITHFHVNTFASNVSFWKCLSEIENGSISMTNGGHGFDDSSFCCCCLFWFLFSLIWLQYALASTVDYLSDLLHLYSPSWSLRSSADSRLLKIPLYKCKAKGYPAFSYFGHSVWNSLPPHIRNATAIDTFNSVSKDLSLQPPRIWLVHVCLICSV